MQNLPQYLFLGTMLLEGFGAILPQWLSKLCDKLARAN